MPDFSKLTTAYIITFFYSCVMSIAATLGYMVDKENGFTTGYLVGIVISLLLWFLVGKKYAKV